MSRWDSRTAESSKDKDHLIRLTVLRNTKSSFFFETPVSCESQDAGGDTLNQIAGPHGVEGSTLSDHLEVPSSASSNVLLGETASFYIGLSNDSNQVLRDVFLKIDVQTSSCRCQLFSSKPFMKFQTEDTLGEVVRYEVKETGPHVLDCSVSYSSQNGEKMYLKKVLKFQVIKPFEVQSKWFFSLPYYLVLEAQVVNATTTNFSALNVTFEPSPLFRVEVAGKRRAAVGRKRDDLSMALLENTRTGLLQGESQAFFFQLTPEPGTLKDTLTKPSIVLGRLDLTWRSSQGELGHLQTSLMPRTNQDRQELLVVPFDLPTTVKLLQPFQAVFRLFNLSDSKRDFRLILLNAPNRSLLWTGNVRRILAPIPSGSHTDIGVTLLPARLGIQMVSGLKLVDINSNNRQYEFSQLAEVLVCSSDSSLLSCSQVSSCPT